MHYEMKLGICTKIRFHIPSATGRQAADLLSRLNQHLRPMRFETFSGLMDISHRWPVEYGKIIQLLLAISFDACRGGYSVENRCSEGVDLEMIRGAKKFAIEVQTTEGPN